MCKQPAPPGSQGQQPPGLTRRRLGANEHETPGQLERRVAVVRVVAGLGSFSGRGRDDHDASLSLVQLCDDFGAPACQAALHHPRRRAAMAKR